jgi:hypothetical protein
MGVSFMFRRILTSVLLGLLLFGTAFAEINLYLANELNGQIRYTPEEGWQGLRLFHNQTRIIGDNNGIKLLAELSSVGDRFKWEPLDSSFPNVNIQLSRVTFSTTGPLYFGGSPATVSFGDIPVKYSPLIMQADDTVKVGGTLYNPMRRGVSIEGFQLPGKLKLDAFSTWERNNDSNRMSKAQGFGSRATFELGAYDLSFIAITRGDIEEAGRNIKKQDKAYLVEIMWEDRNQDFEFRYGNNGVKTQSLSEGELEETQGEFNQFRYGRSLGDNAKVAFEYRDLDPEFNPYYRDRTPRFNEEGKFIGWNKLDGMRFVEGLEGWDSYQQKQVLSELVLREKQASIKLSSDYRKLEGRDINPDGFLRKYDLSFFAPYKRYTFKSNYSSQKLSLLGSNELVSTDIGERIMVGVERSLLSNDVNDLSVNYNWFYEGLYKEELGSKHQVTLEHKSKAGSFKGLEMFAGISVPDANNQKPIYLCGLNYALGEVELEYRWASENKIEDPQRLYGPDGLEYVGYDNLFRFGLSTSF